MPGRRAGPPPLKPTGDKGAVTVPGNFAGKTVGGTVYKYDIFAHPHGPGSKPKPPKLTLEQQASNLVDKIINAQLEPLLTQQRHDAAVRQAFALAIGQMLAQSAAGEAGVWNSVGGDLSSAAGASGAAFNQAQKAGQASVGADLSAIGAPQSQQQQVSQGIAQNYGTNAAFANAPLTGGQGVASAYANNNYNYIPSAFLANAVLGEGNAAYQEQQARLQLLSQRPQLIQSILGQLISQRNSALNYKLAVQKANLDAWAKRVYQNYLTGKANKPTYRTVGGSLYSVDPATGQPTLVVKAPKKPPTQRPYQHVSVGGRAYTFDPNTGLFYDPGTGRKVSPAALKRAARGKFTATQIQRYEGQAESIAQDFYQAIPAGELSPSAAKANPNGIPARTYKQAINEGRRHGIPMFLLIPILNRYYPPGYMGRPILNPKNPQIRIPKFKK